MPLPVDKFRQLSATKGEGQPVTVKQVHAALSKQCPILTNWSTDKYGHCKRECQWRGRSITQGGVEKSCPAR